ncbi:MAG: hypothetical protein FWG03_09615, partial [Clostridiales bacterium]|nr:hypothetical protein [Clostridiales bacterium]
KSRRDVIEQAARDYDRLLAYGDYTIVAGIAEELRPLLESHDENALALWQRISRDFPRGNPVMAAECEAIRSPSEVSSQVRYPKPVYPAAPFSRPSSFGKIRFSYDFRGSAPVLAIANGMVPPRRFDPVDQYRLVVCEDGSDDGLFHAMVYGREGEDGRLIVGRKGVMIRVIDVRGPECVLEIIRTGIQSQEVFVRWSGHKLLMFLSGEGLFALDFDNAGGVITELPPPLIPDIIELHDVAFIGEHADELFTGENRWRICYDILPFPERPLSDPRLEDIKGMLPRKPAEKRAMLLRNGFGNLWTELILKGR